MLLALVCVLPVLLQLMGPIYLVGALLLNGLFLRDAVAIWRNPVEQNVWRLFKFSLLYLALLFLAMGLDGLFYTAPANVADFTWRLPF